MIADSPAPPSPAGMDRGSPAYRAAVLAAVAEAPPLDAETKHRLRAVFAAPGSARNDDAGAAA